MWKQMKLAFFRYIPWKDLQIIFKLCFNVITSRHNSNEKYLDDDFSSDSLMCYTKNENLYNHIVLQFF